jgi:broad specificity phosphatase PhoE
MEITIIQQIEDAGESFKVFVFKGDDKAVLARAQEKFEELIGETCEERGLRDDGSDDRISEGLVIYDSWKDERTPDWDVNWTEIQWKFRESGDNVTLRVYRTPIVTEEEVYR